MKLIADENFPAPLIASLRRLGHDVFAVAEKMPGAADSRVMAVAVDEQRLLLTMDRDFGDLVFHHRQPTPPGVVLFRLTGATPAADSRRILEVLGRLNEWRACFTTVTDKLIRSRPFPH